jgi:hypothetical protein
VTADEVVVGGRLKGIVRADRITLQESANVDSEMFHKNLCIEVGACFEGTSRRSEDPLNVALPELLTSAMRDATSAQQAEQAQSAESSGSPIALEDEGLDAEQSPVVHPADVSEPMSSSDAFAGEMKRLRARLAAWS